MLCVLAKVRYLKYKALFSSRLSLNVINWEEAFLIISFISPSPRITRVGSVVLAHWSGASPLSGLLMLHDNLLKRTAHHNVENLYLSKGHEQQEHDVLLHTHYLNPPHQMLSSSTSAPWAPEWNTFIPYRFTSFTELEVYTHPCCLSFLQISLYLWAQFCHSASFIFKNSSPVYSLDWLS